MLLLASFSCGKKANYSPKNRFSDGTYHAVSRKHDNNSRIPYMSVTVKNHIIAGVYFNVIDSKGREHIKENSKKSFFIQRLNTEMIQKQNAKLTNPDKTEPELFRIYQSLAEAAVSGIKKNESSPIYANIDYVYTAKRSEFMKDGFRGTLSAAYENGVITSVNFSRKDRKGKNAALDDSFTTSFRSKNRSSYASYIQNLSSLSKGKASVVLSEGKSATDRDYNFLAEKINRKNTQVSYKKIKKYLKR